VQDYPPISGYAMEPSLLVRIVAEIPQARVIKLEDPPTPFKIARIRELPGGDAVKIFGGLGGMYLLEELMAGATGAMTGFAFPEILVQVVKHFHSGELEKAKEIFYRYVPVMRFEFQEGIGMAIRKEILRRRGVIQTSLVRAPGANMDASTMRALDELLAWLRINKTNGNWP
jgi:4-hydroxy-tetrahydrodipicolinate synthase